MDHQVRDGADTRVQHIICEEITPRSKLRQIRGIQETTQSTTKEECTGHAESVHQRRFLCGDAEKVLIGDDNQRVDTLLQLRDALPTVNNLANEY